ncbi:poly-gamma-glutamate hydrolase family protein [Streptomyces sp. UNOB3_S3]|uniref:poly-gamma-glutamate hydrolase family protein n=1 Tax=Streptomyces sp. UNOB3_S3 TaxID=2871682 RepID=UPI001E320993|nr:poly-gamma-glutamate hydrolase family protein [Streptomyces sp. UNOB3_S3]MCC3776715.1 poly-gamma-glutamate hydrolase family protein [Streptomyces sp. UNOB3_S3]
MRPTTRRSLLTGLAAAAVTTAATRTATATSAAPAATAVTAASGDELFASNTALYVSPLFKEGTDWARRYRRTGLDTVPGHSRATAPLTAVVAPHGGNLEDGTSELCLAVAGYAPEDPMARYGSGPAYDYWMFEVLATESRAVQQMHVTSTHCDDPAALAIVGGSRHAVSVHGCKNPGGSGSQKLIQIGGRDATMKKNLYEALRDRLGSGVTLTLPDGGLDGDEPLNICNRTYSGAGGQLELSTDLRRAMFGDFASPATRAATYGRSADGTAARYWDGFVAAVREAIARTEKSGG